MVSCKTSFLRSTFKPQLNFYQTQGGGLRNGRNLSFNINCKVKISQDETDKDVSKKIVLSEGAPPLADETGGFESVEVKGNAGSGIGVLGSLKRLPRKILAVLSFLQLAIAEMFTVACLMAIGTFIDQGEPPAFYFQIYPEDDPFLGFFTWRWVLTLGLDHMYSSPIFLGMLALLGASLMACTYTTQIPLIMVARRLTFFLLGVHVSLNFSLRELEVDKYESTAEHMEISIDPPH